MKKPLFTLMAVIMTAMSFAQTPVTPTSKGETWHISEGTFTAYVGEDYGWVDYTPYIQQTMQVSIDGSDIYIQGLAAAFMSDSWVKGTISGNKVIIPSGQYLGRDSDGDEYLNGQDVNSTNPNDPAVDIVFTYNAEAGKLTLDSLVAILESGKANSINATYAYWEGLVLTKSTPNELELLSLPEGVPPVEYTFSGYDSYYSKTITRTAAVAFDGNTVYVNGVSEIQPESWIKGTLNGSSITFAANQYIGMNYIYSNNTPLFFNPDSDVIFQYDAANNTLKCEKFVTASSYGVYDNITNAVWTMVIEKVGTPATPTITGFELLSEDDPKAYVRYPCIEFMIPSIDTEGNGMLTTKMSYALFVEESTGSVSQLTLTPEKYLALDSSLTEIPYNYNDVLGHIQAYDNYRLVYLLQGAETIASWNKIGIKSIYRGGGETHESETVWFDVQDYIKKMTGISAVNIHKQESYVYYNLKGLQVKNPKHGLYIHNGRKVFVK